ncbi:penicillin acylase family protein [Shewanella intestini]|uniref:Penicillin acylase family protein n=1 Tax=Shewanella intestini TaxID=2017544 RepID=A0ABS5HYP5_9GAMM|nr:MULTISPECIES: penicillin acylase family protein [Shewanella]MBR9726896.1 penicillin acylase family protein [Shewanella intestini]MRG34538.1 penicillin acylase family protein [Shewanella sp. XMDDZSB0408]
MSLKNIAKWGKRSLILSCSLVIVGLIGLYVSISLSLPKLSAHYKTNAISKDMRIERDQLGTAIISAENRLDAAYGLGYAHGQDRFFQMDLLRRNAAGELSELFGDKALELDKSRRFHQLRQRAKAIVDTLPAADKAILVHYRNGVNAALQAQILPSFEYLFTNNRPQPWQLDDSLLVIYSMYLDLQGNTLKRDLTLTQLQLEFGQPMVNFILQPSPYQAALDGSEFELQPHAIPALTASQIAQAKVSTIKMPQEVGSNNWAVTDKLTHNGHAMVSDDMHLSFSVPIIWYRAQLNYLSDSLTNTTSSTNHVQVTGVSLPGTPAIVVGSNNYVAWGFTNAYIDTADWVNVDGEATTIIKEPINAKTTTYIYELEMSAVGPVRQIDGHKYALSWVGHQDYAVDMSLLKLEQAKDVQQVKQWVSEFGMPVQNIVAADKSGAIMWTLAGAISRRDDPSDIAVDLKQYQQQDWQQLTTHIPYQINPSSQRIWTANSRVVSTQDNQRLGDGGYALGARAQQIQQAMFSQQRFNEHDFYQLQLDNQATFLLPWHRFLVTQLEQHSDTMREDLRYLRQWQQCACADSVGYTLVRHFRQTLLEQVFAPLETALQAHQLSLSPVMRYLEPAIWQLLAQQPQDWLPNDVSSWEQLSLNAYQASKTKLLKQHSSNGQLRDLAWGKVNALTVQHPFSKSMPLLSHWLDMPTQAGFGDTFMPAVQGKSFGASQRFIVQPGLEKNAILTLPGGQSGHPLSDFYRSGFEQYVKQQHTPLLPGHVLHTLSFQAQ